MPSKKISPVLLVTKVRPCLHPQRRPRHAHQVAVSTSRRGKNYGLLDIIGAECVLDAPPWTTAAACLSLTLVDDGAWRLYVPGAAANRQYCSGDLSVHSLTEARAFWQRSMVLCGLCFTMFRIAGAIGQRRAAGR